MEITAYFLAVVIGITLGLIGAGGSILTVPILVYLLQLPVENATGYSLFIVGVSALVASVAYMRKGKVNYNTVWSFGISSIITVFLTRKLMVPAIPEIIFEIGTYQFTKETAIMLLFAALMILASISMIRKRNKPMAFTSMDSFQRNLLMMTEGIGVGVLTGLVGVGGGFLIVPALVVLVGLPMKTAVGTSLLIIALKSITGFAGDLSNNIEVPWQMLLIFTSLSIIGSIIGYYFSNFIPAKKLKPAFGWFVLVGGVIIIINETFN